MLRSKGDLASRGALLSLLLATSAAILACGAGLPSQVVPNRSGLTLTLRVIDVDPLVQDDCQGLVVEALRRHGFAPVTNQAGASVTLYPRTEIEVVFPDGISADLTATLFDSTPPRRILASSVAAYYEPAHVDMRSRGGRYRTQGCAVGAERLAVAMVQALGEDTRQEASP